MVLDSIAGTIRDAVKILIDFGKDTTRHLGEWLKDIGRFIFNNFRYYDPNQLMVLALVLFLLVTILMSLFVGGIGIGEGTKRIGLGSGSVSSGTGDSDTGSIYKDRAGDEGQFPEPTEGGSGDTDGDSIPDGNDNDIDGDGIPNSEDFDIDGDGISNDDDPTPCGDFIEDCPIPMPILCGNDFCDEFETVTQTFEVATAVEDCSQGNFIFYNIPVFCFGDGTSGDSFTIYRYNDLPLILNYAVCGQSELQQRLSSRCNIDENRSVWYRETALNCPLDCENPDYNCYRDYTCDFYDNCADYFLSCCPYGTVYYGHCVECSNIISCCNDGTGVTKPDKSLNELRQSSFHCECENDIDCIDDLGGSTCCADETYHGGFCYNSLLCDIP